jgi:chromosome segregation ATPase
LSDSAENAVNAQTQPTFMQNLRKLYQVQLQQVMDLEKCESVSETDLETLKQCKINLSSLQERILNRALSAEQEAEEEAQLPKILQADYLLLREENKKLWTALESRDKNIATLKGRMKYELEYCHKDIIPLKMKIKALEEENSTLKREARKKIGNTKSIIRDRQKIDQRLIYTQASRMNLSKQVKESKVEIAKLKTQLSESLKSQTTQEKNFTKCLKKIKKDHEEIGGLKSQAFHENLVNCENRLRKAIEELGGVKGFANAMVRQLQNKNTKLESLQELEKGHKLMMKKLKSGKNNLFLEQASGIEISLATFEMMTNQSDSLPSTTSAASSDPRQDHDGEHIVSSQEHHQIMIVVESDEDEQLEDEVSEEVYDVASGDEGRD